MASPRSTPFSSLRRRLLLLTLVALLPAVALNLYTNLEQRRAAFREVQENARRLVRLASANQERLIEGARHLLPALALLIQGQRLDPPACDALLADLLTQYPGYLNLGVIEPGGSLRCSALPRTGRVSLADRSYFQRAVATRAFAIGEYQIGRVTRQASVNFGQPVLGPDGKVEAVVFAALDLGWINRLAAEARLPAGATLTVIDRNGTILARYPDPERWVGRLVEDAPIVQAILSRRSEGTAEALGLDGVRRLYAFAPLGGSARAGQAYVSIGIPRSAAFAGIDRALGLNLAGLGLVALLALAGARVVGDRFVLRGVHESLRRHADELERRIAEQTDALLQAKGFLENLVAASPGILFQARMPSFRLTYISPNVERLLGYSPDEVLNTPGYLRDRIPPEDRERTRTMLAKARAAGTRQVEFEHRFLHRDDSERWFYVVERFNGDAAGDEVDVFGYALDITERKRAEAAQRESEARLQAILDNSPAVIVLKDADGRYLLVNRQFEQVFGTHRDQVVGKTQYDLFPRATADVLRANDLTVLGEPHGDRGGGRRRRRAPDLHLGQVPALRRRGQPLRRL